MDIKAISLWQPWASLLVGGHKQYETRSWSTRHCGWLAIHAAKYDGVEVKLACSEAVFRNCLSEMGYKRPSELPKGAIVGFVFLNGCYRTQDIVVRLPTQERVFGDYRYGRFAWHCPLSYRLQTPIPMRGAQGMFTIEVPDSFGWGEIMERLEKGVQG